MKVMKFFLAFLLCILPSLAFAGTTYYIDATNGSDNNSGMSMNKAWNTISRVNNHSFSTGDDVYFKCGETWNEQLVIDWDGSESDSVVIGAFYDDGGSPAYGVSGSRPIIDGNFTVPGDELGLVRYRNGSGYVTIKELHVKNSGGYGIEISYVYEAGNPHTDYNTIENCYIQNSKWQGIVVARGSYNTIENNTVERASYNFQPGAGIEVTGMNSENTSLYNIIRGNTVYWCYEGIGIYKGARYTTVEYNASYDNRSFHLYVANARNATIRYNLVYEGINDFDSDSDWLIGTDCEGHNPGIVKTTGYVEIYNNLISGGSKGIFIANNCDVLEIPQTGNRIYNNTVVDCDQNFYVERSGSTWSDNIIKNNISWTITAGTVHSNNYSPTGVTWSHNNFDDSVTGNAAINARIYNPGLKKTSGWRSLAGGDVDGTEFSLTPSSQNIDDGVSIVGYNDRIYDANYTADPNAVSTAIDNSPNIGAWMYGKKVEKERWDTKPPLLNSQN